MNKYNFIKNTIQKILLEKPVDIIDDNGTYIIRDIESKNERLFDNVATRVIGSTNFVASTEVVIAACKDHIIENISNNTFMEIAQIVYTDILTNLEKEGIIRTKPDIKRKKIEMVINNDK